MLLLLVMACNDYTLKDITADQPLSLTVTSPEYGSFLGDGPVLVTGVVSPANAWVTVGGTSVVPAADGSFSAELAFTDRALVADVRARSRGQELRELIPVFDGVDPRAYDPGALRALLTPTGLDALEPMVATLVDGLGLLDQLSAAIPAIETDWVSIVPTGVTSTGTTVDLAPAEGAILANLTLHDVMLSADVNVLGLEFTLAGGLGEVTAGLTMAPELDADDMLWLSVLDAEVALGDVQVEIAGYELEDWLEDTLLDPVASLLGEVVDLLGSTLVTELDALPLGGPFAFSTDLMGISLGARLAEIDPTSTGVGMGVTLSYDGAAAEDLPSDLAVLPSQTSDGDAYQMGVALHEGMFNTLIDETLAGFLDFEMVLEGEYGMLLGNGFAAIPGGDQIPADVTAYCLALHVGDARVVRMVEGAADGVLARAYMPDLRVTLDIEQEGVCNPWLDAMLFATVDLKLDGTAVSADLDVPSAFILYYGATGVDPDEVGAQLGSVVSGLAGLLAGSLSFDLGDIAPIEGLTLSPVLVDVEPLDETGLYALYLNLF